MSMISRTSQSGISQLYGLEQTYEDHLDILMRQIEEDQIEEAVFDGRDPDNFIL